MRENVGLVARGARTARRACRVTKGRKATGPSVRKGFKAIKASTVRRASPACADCKGTKAKKDFPVTKGLMGRKDRKG